MYRIGLDIDGVCAEFSASFLEYLGLPTHEADSWTDPRFRENMHRVDGDLYFWSTIKPIIPGNFVRFQPELYCTSRNIPSDISRAWLVNKGFPHAPVLTVPRGESKVDALKGKIDLFLDDAIHNFEELNAAGIPCLLVTRSHNVHYDAGKKRVESLLDFQKRFILPHVGIFDPVAKHYLEV